MPRRNHPTPHKKKAGTRKKMNAQAMDISETLNEYGFFEHDMLKKGKRRQAMSGRA